jgi:hypothetical protein
MHCPFCFLLRTSRRRARPAIDATLLSLLQATRTLLYVTGSLHLLLAESGPFIMHVFSAMFDFTVLGLY